MPPAELTRMLRGVSSTASGNYSHAEAPRAVASGHYSHAEGKVLPPRVATTPCRRFQQQMRLCRAIIAQSATRRSRSPAMPDPLSRTATPSCFGVYLALPVRTASQQRTFPRSRRMQAEAPPLASTRAGPRPYQWPRGQPEQRPQRPRRGQCKQCTSDSAHAEGNNNSVLASSTSCMSRGTTPRPVPTTPMPRVIIRRLQPRGTRRAAIIPRPTNNINAHGLRSFCGRAAIANTRK